MWLLHVQRCLGKPGKNTWAVSNRMIQSFAKFHMQHVRTVVASPRVQMHGCMASARLHHQACACMRLLSSAGSDRSAWIQTPASHSHGGSRSSRGRSAAQHRGYSGSTHALVAHAGPQVAETCPPADSARYNGTAVGLASPSQAPPAAAYWARRAAFGGSNQQALMQQPQPLDVQHAEWLQQEYGLQSALLDHCGMGTATVFCPATNQPERVIMLPYTVNGATVDATYLLPQPGKPLLRWMARKGEHVFVTDDERQQLAAGVRDMVVFVTDELEKLAIMQASWGGSSQDDSLPPWPVAVALPNPIPSWQQVLQPAVAAAAPELRLLGLQQQLLLLQHRQRSTSAATPAAGRVKGGASPGPGDTAEGPGGLQLLLPGAQAAILAFGTPGGEQTADQALADKLAEMLGVHACVYLRWQLAHLDHMPQLQALAAAPGAAPVEGEELDDLDEDARQHKLAQLQQQIQHSLLGVAQVHGPLLLSRLLTEPRYWGVWPVTGLERFLDYHQQILERYHAAGHVPVAVSTGWESLDPFYKVAPGEVTLVTGVPNSGKSEWLDALAVSLAERHGWRFALASMEKAPLHHARQLVEKRVKKPFWSGGYGGNVQQMTQEELEAGFKWVSGHFFPILSADQQQTELRFILQSAKVAKVRYGISGLIIDPYNELATSTGSGTTGLLDHEVVNELMGQLRMFARSNQVHVWLVAHPKQRLSWRGEAPTLSDISGGANFWNKADNGIVVHRQWDKLPEMQQAGGHRRSSEGQGSSAAAGSNTEVQIHVQKVRNKTTGCQGQCVLEYDRVTGRYWELGETPDWGANPFVRISSGSSATLEVLEEGQ